MKKYLKYSVLSGFLFALSWPTYGFPFLIFIAWVPLLLLEHEIAISDVIKRKKRTIVLLSFITFFIFNAIVTQWLFQVSVSRFQAYFLPLIANTILMTATFFGYHLFKKQQGTLYGLFFLPCIWIAFEKLHLEWQLNWPWLNLGNAFADYHQFIQWYQTTGTFGGTLWVLIVNILVFYFYKLYLVTRLKKYYVKIGTALVLGIGLPSAISLYQYYSYKDVGEEIETVLLQPNIDPYTEKYEISAIQTVEILKDLMDSATHKTQLIIAPETAFPGQGAISVNTLQQDILVQSLQTYLKHKSAVFISGFDGFERVKEDGIDVNYDANSKQYYKRYNAVLQLENKATQIPTYSKSKLVPGVESFPYQNTFKPLLGQAMLDFGGSVNSLARPHKPTVFTNKSNRAKVAPLVCYESIFGEYTAQFVQKGANILSISTNDSWWDDSQGHKQLLAYAKLRALENRRYIVRSANTGISAVINARGDVVAHLPYLEKGSLRANAKLRNDTTTYSENGDYLATIAMLLLGILIGIALAQWLITVFNIKKL